MDSRPILRSSGARPKRRGRRALWVALATGLALVILWVSGFEPVTWWEAGHSHAPPIVSTSNRPRPPVSVVQPTPLGTDSSVSVAPLLLHLVATRLGRNTHEGYADIGVDVRTPQTYRAGAILANGARIEEIYSNYVILAREGHTTRLYVEGQAPPEYAPNALTTGVARSILTVGGAVSHSVAEADSHEALTDVIRVAPVYEGENVTALQVYPNPHSGLFQELGLEPGDRITSINGVTVTDPRTAIASLRHLTTGEAMTVTLVRGAERKTLSLDGSVVVNARARL